mmetsp:Transcript_23596/g.3910  ORF Transcript_23596/g.3910 Transcript_23596/m.3910 type:complete len:109 (+) Transcript_23596:1419-1745(+)
MFIEEFLKIYLVKSKKRKNIEEAGSQSPRSPMSRSHSIGNDLKRKHLQKGENSDCENEKNYNLTLLNDMKRQNSPNTGKRNSSKGFFTNRSKTPSKNLIRTPRRAPFK